MQEELEDINMMYYVKKLKYIDYVSYSVIIFFYLLSFTGVAATKG